MTNPFAETLKILGAPAPWRLHESEIGVILDATGADVLVIDANSNRPNAKVHEIALRIVAAINGNAGQLIGMLPPILRDPPRLAPDSEAELRQGKK